ncbi:phage portal protein [Arthrobacter sp. HS15c]|uniref:phage portal protein n=1 Tax=Arthrobacter sp. HS15c TaxID=3230279 RepID=UPI0034650893
MTLFFGRSEQRMLGDTFGSFGTGGVKFGGSMKAALRVAPVYSATGLLADSISVMPVQGYTDAGGIKRRLDEKPALLANPHPDPMFTIVEWLHQFVISYCLRGNAYGIITAVDNRGYATKIGWLHPDSVQVDETSGLPQYSYNGKPLDRATVVHIPGYTLPGSSVGVSPIELFRSQLETADAATRFGRKWFQNGSTPSGHLKYSESKLDDTQTSRAKARFKASVVDNDIFVSGNDWSWQALSVKPNEAQFLETIKATANTIASIYHVPPEEIGGEAANGLTYSTLELNQIKFQIRAQLPIYTRLENHLNRLLPPAEYTKLNADATIRTDLKTRMEARGIALRNGIETLDEARAGEDRAPLTPDEITAWQKNFGTRPDPAAPDEMDKAKRIAEIIQKIYLGVGTVITEDEAREIIRMTGMDLPANVTVKQPQIGGQPSA